MRNWKRGRGSSRNRGGLGRLAAGLLFLAGFSACEDILEVADNPDTISGEDVAGEGSFPARFVGTQSDFANGVDNGILYGALFTDELTWGGSFVARQEVDLRNVPTSNDIVATEIWTVLQTAAKTAKDLQRDIEEGFFPNLVPQGVDSPEFARVSLLSGYARVFLADLFCTVAFDGTGPELSSGEVYEMAAEDFTAAIDATGAEAEVRNAALVGRARVGLQLGNEGPAEADAVRVPGDFVFLVQYSGATAREENDNFNFTWNNERLTVDPRFRDLTVDGTEAPDPRVQLFATGGTGFNGSLLQFNPMKYNARSASIRLATWEEAQLILAEIRGGEAARAILNDLRAARGIADPITPEEASTPGEIRDRVIEEKARALFMEGQRMPDLRRYADRFGLDLFPAGPGFGDQRCMPLPDLERDNNPDI